MICQYCGYANSEPERADQRCACCAKPLARAAAHTKVPEPWRDHGRQAAARFASSPITRIRSKRGWPVVANTLPTPPVQTASAASPLPPVPPRLPKPWLDGGARQQRSVKQQFGGAERTRPSLPEHSIQPALRQGRATREPTMETAHLTTAAAFASEGAASTGALRTDAAQTTRARAPQTATDEGRTASTSPANAVKSRANASGIRPTPAATPGANATAPRESRPLSRPAAPAHDGRTPSVAAMSAHRPQPLPQRRPALHDPAPSYGGWLAGLLALSIGLGWAGAWWVDRSPTADTDVWAQMTARLSVNRDKPAPPAVGNLQPKASAPTVDVLPAPVATVDLVDGERSEAPVAASAPQQNDQETEKDVVAERPTNDSAGDKAATGQQLAKAKESRSAKPTSARSSSGKSASLDRKQRIKEIDRVRTQAYSETRRERAEKENARDGRRSGAAALEPQSSKKKTATRQTVRLSKRQRNVLALNRCQRISHLIKRERCKWRICGDNWGRDGCPSYGPQLASS